MVDFLRVGLVEIHNVNKFNVAATESSAILETNADNAVSVSVDEIGIYRPTLIQ